MVYPLDHLVLPVANLRQARDRLSCLGFTVAADGHHPFGTSNACIFLADGTYLEPLAITDAVQYAAALKSGNSFVRHDEVYRFRRGEDGLSGIVLGTSNAEADDHAFRKAGFSGGDMVEFSRSIVLPDGSEAKGAFRLAFAADLRAPDIFMFACQRLAAFPSDRTSLETHRNGVNGLKAVLLTAAKPAAFAEFLETATSGGEVLETAFGVAVHLPNVQISVFGPDGLEGGYDLLVSKANVDLKAVGLIFASANLAVTESHLAANGITYTRKQDRILVKPAPGQGVLFAFEETL